MRHLRKKTKLSYLNQHRRLGAKVEKRYNKKNCFICNESFIPEAPNQKTCKKEECRKKLHNRRIQRYRHRTIQKTCKQEIYDILSKKGARSFNELEKQVRHGDISRTSIYYALNQLKAEGLLNKIRGYYSLVPDIIQGEKCYVIGEECIHIKFNNYEYIFEDYLESEGFYPEEHLETKNQNQEGSVEKDPLRSIESINSACAEALKQEPKIPKSYICKPPDGKKLTPSEIHECKTVAIIAYIEIWALMLNILIDARLQPMDKKFLKKTHTAISILFNNSIYARVLLPPKLKIPIVPAFSEILMIYFLAGRINQPKDISDLFKELSNQIEDYLDDTIQHNCASLSERGIQILSLTPNYLCELCPGASMNPFFSQDLFMNIINSGKLEGILSKDVLEKMIYYVEESKKRTGTCCPAMLIDTMEELRKLSERADVCYQIMKGINDTVSMRGQFFHNFIGFNINSE